MQENAFHGGNNTSTSLVPYSPPISNSYQQTDSDHDEFFNMIAKQNDKNSQ
jgi:hypothetical protein